MMGKTTTSVLLVLLFSCTCLFAAPVSAQCGREDADRPSIGLVLGGGGARGSAHIGVIRVLEELNIPVDCVGGTSIGSLIGALYATGMNADQLEAVMLGLDWDDLFVDDTGRRDQPFRRKRDDNLALFGPKLGIERDAALIKSGALSGQKISFMFESLVKERVQVTDFDEMPIPFRAVAADIADGSEVVLADGDLALAMRASMSLPGVFSPVPWGERMLVDGGIANNVPVNVVRAMGADVLIVVNVGSGLKSQEDLKTAIDVIGQLTNILIQNNTNTQVASLGDNDILITPPLGTEVTTASFDKTATGIEIGFKAADALRPSLAGLSIPEEDYLAYRAGITGKLTPSPVIHFVELDNQSRFDDTVLLSRLTIEEGKPLNVAALDENVRQIYALGFMDQVRYEVVEKAGQTGIVIRAGQDSRGTQLLETGLDFFGDSSHSDINVRLGYLNTAIDSFGSELRVLGQLGASPGLYTYLYKFVNPELKVYVEPHLFAEQLRLTSYDGDGNALLSNQVTRYGGSFAVGRELGRQAAISAGIRRYAGDVEVLVGPPELPGYDFDGGEYFFNFAYDRLDDRYFPGDGGYLSVSYLVSSESLGADAEYEQLQIAALYAKTVGRHSAFGGLRYNQTMDGPAPLYDQFRAGGFMNMSGYHPNELVGSNYAMLLGGYRYQFAGSGLMPASLGMTLEYGQVAEQASDLFDDALFNGSAFLGYRSPIGPLYLGVGAGENGRWRYFLSIGRVFGTSTLGR